MDNKNKIHKKNPTWKKTITELLQDINKSWDPIFKDTSILSESKCLDEIFEKELNTFGDHIEILPNLQDLIFNAFKISDFPIKVVILGQDPYFSNVNESMGLSFSVPNGVKKPPSLVNIFKEVSTNIKQFSLPESGDLTKWGKQGVLLLNTALTVRHKQKESHLDIWKKFTDTIIELISKKSDNPVVFILWGSHAKKRRKCIQNSLKHLILEANHPSPLSANRGGFFGCSHFSKTNEFLIQHGMEPINWDLSTN